MVQMYHDALRAPSPLQRLEEERRRTFAPRPTVPRGR